MASPSVVPDSNFISHVIKRHTGLDLVFLRPVQGFLGCMQRYLTFVGHGSGPRRLMRGMVEPGADGRAGARHMGAE